MLIFYLLNMYLVEVLIFDMKLGRKDKYDIEGFCKIVKEYKLFIKIVFWKNCMGKFVIKFF